MQKNRVDEFIKNPKKALFILALPLLVGMFVQVLYNIVDTAFVGRLGADSIAALTFSFPLFFILVALNSGLSTGMSSRISRYLGEKNKQAAENTALHGLVISVVLAVVIFALGLIFLKPIFYLFGATNTVLELAISYMSIILFGIFFMFPSFIIHGIFSAQGDTKTPMKATIAALVMNIILDPIFIYALKQGVKGAAIATIISFFFGLILYIYYLRKKSYLRLHPKTFRFSFPICKEICRVGAPASIMMLLMSVSYMFFNRFVAHFGTEFVAGYGIVSRLESVAVMPMIALSTAMMTLTGMFFGAKKYKLLKSTTWYTVRIGLLFTLILGIIFFITPSVFLRIFTPDTTLLSIGSAYLKVLVFTFPLMAIGMTLSRTMQGMGLGLPGLVFSSVRLILVSVPLAYIFVFVLNHGFLSMIVAMVIGGIIANMVVVTWYRTKLKHLGV